MTRGGRSARWVCWVLACHVLALVPWLALTDGPGECPQVQRMADGSSMSMYDVDGCAAIMGSVATLGVLVFAEVIVVARVVGISTPRRRLGVATVATAATGIVCGLLLAAPRGELHDGLLVMLGWLSETGRASAHRQAWRQGTPRTTPVGRITRGAIAQRVVMWIRQSRHSTHDHEVVAARHR